MRPSSSAAVRPSSSASNLSNLGVLSLGKDLGRPRSLVVPRGFERSWSSPALAAAFSLRKYAVEVNHVPGTKTRRAFAGDPLEIPVEKVDLIGGNGKWRQLRAQEEFARRQQQDEEDRRQELIRAAERKRRQAELEEKKRRHQLEEEKRWQEEREQKRREQKEREQRKRDEEEKVRVEKEEKEEERRKRMPRTCDTCGGTGKCQECEGKGYVHCVFLVSKKAAQNYTVGTHMDHGRVLQGCDNCGGYRHNMLGDPKHGTGECPDCQGLGKIWPEIEEEVVTSPKGRKPTMALDYFMNDRTGEVKVT